MIPSPAYFPTSLQERAAWYDNFNTVLQPIGASLGLSVGDLTQIAADNAMMQFLATFDVSVSEYASAVRSYRRVVTEGVIGEPAAVFPADLTPTVPATVPTGLFERLDGFVRRIRVAPAFTLVVGVQLGIVRQRTDIEAVVVGTEQPTITAMPQPGSVVNVKFVRGKSDGIFIETQLDNQLTWDAAGRYLKSPAVISIPKNPDNLPRNVQIRARYLDGNDPVGDWSQIETVQTIP